jgi:acyl carrier protein phosphodiesterase
MNYLAHAYLSFNKPEILVGNMISDFVKGKKKFEFDKKVQHGIMLHRAIDNFTDTHIVTKEATKVFKPAAGLYSGAFTDIIYDHFLALDLNELAENEWMDFSLTTYQTLYQFENILPKNFAKMLPYMSSQNWLFNYRLREGIKNSFKGLVHRAKYLESSEDAFLAFENNYDFLKKCYEKFFPELKKFAMIQLLNTGDFTS